MFLFFEILENPPIILLPFDVTANWENGDLDYPVVDEESFITFISSRFKQHQNDLSNITIENFTLNSGRLQCDLYAEGTTFELSEMEVTEVNSIGNLEGLVYLYLMYNQISSISLSSPLSTSLNTINMSYNSINDWEQLTDMVNNLHTTSDGYIFTNQNTVSSGGTNFKIIAESKGWTVI